MSLTNNTFPYPRAEDFGLAGVVVYPAVLTVVTHEGVCVEFSGGEGFGARCVAGIRVVTPGRGTMVVLRDRSHEEEASIKLHAAMPRRTRQPFAKARPEI